MLSAGQCLDLAGFPTLRIRLDLDILDKVSFSLLILLTFGQLFIGGWFILRLWRFRQPLLADSECPPAAIVLCLRGSDPFLRDCLGGLLIQDYPDYCLHIVIDSESDPSWEVVNEILKGKGRPESHVEVLKQRLPTCSLKASSMIQAVGNLDKEVKVVAFADADIVPHPSWLRELVTPLVKENVAISTGNRWYMPRHLTWGSLVRYCWNAGAIVQMVSYRIPWGGTLGMRRSLFHDGGLVKRWAQVLSDDTMLFSEANRRGLRIEFVPSLIMVNREDVRFMGCFSWIVRQLLMSRLYHPRWPLVLLHGLLSTFALLFAIGVIVTTAYTTQVTAIFSLAGLITYELSLLSLLLGIEMAVGRLICVRGERIHCLSVEGILRIVAAVLLTQIIYPVALVRAMVIREISWRGVHYKIDGPFDITLLEDGEMIGDGQSSHSL